MLGERRKNFWLKGCRMNPIGVQTFHDNLGLFCKVVDRSIIDNNVGRCNRLSLVKTPNVQFVYRFNAGNLRYMLKPRSHDLGRKREYLPFQCHA